MMPMSDRNIEEECLDMLTALHQATAPECSNVKRSMRCGLLPRVLKSFVLISHCSKTLVGKIVTVAEVAFCDLAPNHIGLQNKAPHRPDGVPRKASDRTRWSCACQILKPESTQCPISTLK